MASSHMRARVKLRISIKVEVPHPAGGARVLEPSLFYGFPLPFPFSNVFAEAGSCAYASLHFLLKFLESVRTVPFVGARRGFCYATSQVHKN